MNQLTEEKRAEIRINDAKSKNMKRKCETEEVTRERLESASTYKEKIPQKSNLSEKLEKKRRKRRLGKSIGIEDGLAMSWVTKKMNDMNVEEKQEYAKHRKRQSRENDSKEKKIAQNIKKREYNYERRFARYRQAKTRDLRDSDEDTNETNGEFLQRYLKWKETDTKKYKFRKSKVTMRIRMIPVIFLSKKTMNLIGWTKKMMKNVLMKKNLTLENWMKNSKL